MENFCVVLVGKDLAVSRYNEALKDLAIFRGSRNECVEKKVALLPKVQDILFDAESIVYVKEARGLKLWSESTREEKIDFLKFARFFYAKSL